ncbi:mitochondrial potassium channel ATP-binding subunit-like [Clavelina lepadiformis]|uniref:mitochondrial potassium channel ATP-binding subunit-like n=1 Tax=Clavelina lepadiformis TaxID=159417 RepID=UPI004042325C
MTLFLGSRLWSKQVFQQTLLNPSSLQTVKQSFNQKYCKVQYLNFSSIKILHIRPILRRIFKSNVMKFGLLVSTSLAAVNAALKSTDVKVMCEKLETNHHHHSKVEENADFPFYEFFWNYLVKEIVPLTLAVVAALVGAAMNMKIPEALGDLINSLNKLTHSEFRNGADYFQELKNPVWQLVSLYICQALTTFAYISLLSHAGENIACKLRQDLFRSYLHQDVCFHDQHKTGALIDRLTSDIQDFKSSFKLCLSQGLKSTTQTFGCIYSLYSTSPKLTLVLATTIPLLVLVGALIGASLRKLSKLAQKHAADATAKANEVVANFRTVRAFANEPLEERNYNNITTQSCHINQYLGIGIGAFQGLTNVALNGIVLGVIYAGGYLVMTEEINPGQLMSFLVSSQMIQRSLSSLSILFGTAVRGVTAGARVFEYILAEPDHHISSGRKIPYHSLLGHLKFDNVHFKYPQRPDHEVLKGVNLDIKPCRTVALCGLSGAGKSTVASLVERFYDPVSGSITLDGIDLKDLDASWLRGSTIGFINQEPVLFSGTIEENIRYGQPDAPQRDVEEAARLANADSFIRAFPRGYGTVVGERGVALSGGQKQRIAIARALLKNPSILILDEATSALDAESERLVQDALDHVMAGRTTLIIAHRLSTIRNADVIAVMKDGKVVEVGSHHQLKKLNGIYAELIKLQDNNE